jgi:hypothetical protein
LTAKNTLLTGFDLCQSVSSRVDSSRISLSFSDFDSQRGPWDMHAIEFDVDVMDTILSGHESDGVVVAIDGLNEAVVFSSWWRNDLKTDEKVIYLVVGSWMEYFKVH